MPAAGTRGDKSSQLWLPLRVFLPNENLFPVCPRELSLKNLRLSKCNGNVLEVPNVIQCLIPERIAVQYEQYCKEVEFTPFNKRTPLRVLAACGTTVRKNLQGLDYFAADRASAFDKMITLLTQLKRPGWKYHGRQMAGNAQELKTLPKGGLQDKILPEEIIVQFRVCYDRWMKEVKKHFLQA